MKLLVLLAVLGAAAAADDQQAEDATFVSTYATHPHPLTYSAGYTGYPYSAYPAAAAYRPSVYSSAYGAAYNPLAYHGLYSGVYGGYAAPAVHSLKKRDTAAAEDDQQADETHHVSTYAGHPLAYTAGYPYTTYNAAYNVPSVYSAGYNVPSVYSAAPVYSSYGLQTPASTAPLAYAGLPYAYRPYV